MKKSGGYRKLNTFTYASIIQLAKQEAEFLDKGGFRERMNSARLTERDRQNADPEAPCCPDCGKPMRRCTAKAGQNAGKPFWGCTGFPDCRGIVNIPRE